MFVYSIGNNVNKHTNNKWMNEWVNVPGKNTFIIIFITYIQDLMSNINVWLFFFFFFALEAIGLTKQFKLILAKNHPLRQEEGVLIDM